MTTYSTGTISVGAGSTSVTGTGTSWTTSGVRAGDLLIAAGSIVPIAMIGGNGALTLARAWPGGALSGSNYDILMVDDGVRTLVAANTLMQMLSGGTLSSLAGLASDANKLPYFSGVGTMALADLTSQARSLLSGTGLSRSGSTYTLNGLLSGTAVTQSAADATAGRLMKVGDFGLGVTENAPLLDNIDATNMPSGLYRTTSSSLGGFPAGSNPFGHAIVHRHNTGTVWQTYTPVGNAGGTAGRLWHRIYNPLVTSWLPWRLVYDQGTVLGTVSQSGGVPTGALMQGNASAAAPTGGWTERLADGFQTVHHSLTSSASANTTWTYNSAFLAGSSPVITAQPIGDADYRVRIVSRTETACVFSIRDGADNRVAVPVDLTARGRWSNMA